MGMQAGQIVTMFRREVDDPLVPGGQVQEPDADSLWKDTEIAGYLQEAVIELARRTLFFNTSKTISYQADQELIERPEGYLDMRAEGAYRVDGSDRVPLLLRNMVEMDEAMTDDYGLRGMSKWITEKGPPKVLVTDYEQGHFKMAPIPEQAGSVQLFYYHYPVINIVGTTGDVEFEALHHIRALLSWMKYLAYQKQDAETLDLRRSEMFGLQFEREADRLDGEVKRGRRRPGNVAYGGL